VSRWRSRYCYFQPLRRYCESVPLDLEEEVSFVDPEASAEEIKQAVRPNTKVLFAETIANPALIVIDFDKLAKVARELDVPFIVDNTFPSPYLCRPLELGANIVTHSSTKYIDGHATSVGGVIVDGGNYNWENGKFPEFNEPDPTYHGVVYTKDFKDAPFVVKARVQWIRDLGVYLSPMNAFLSHKGLETLHVRMDRHCANAQALAEFLEQHENVSWVNYPGLKSNSQYEIVMNALKLAAIVVHVADVRTCVLHPASMTHRQLNEDEQRAAGVSPDLIRVSVGIENIEDIIADFDQALSNI
jgi:O-acetylhomoserine (thiol)-lyase